MTCELKPVTRRGIHRIKNIILLNPRLQKIQTIPVCQFRYKVSLSKNNIRHKPLKEHIWKQFQRDEVILGEGINTYNIRSQTPYSGQDIDVLPYLNFLK